MNKPNGVGSGCTHHKMCGDCFSPEAVADLEKEVERLKNVIKTGGAMYRLERASMGITPGGIDPVGQPIGPDPLTAPFRRALALVAHAIPENVELEVPRDTWDLVERCMTEWPSEESPDYSWIKVKRWVDDPSKPWEERFEALKKHHEVETKFLIGECKRAQDALKEKNNGR